jgi:predicted dienelactone hydrolase
MRTLEVAIPCLLLFYLVWPLASRRPRPLVIQLLPVLALVLTLFHLALEKYRWEMLGIYTLILLFSSLSLAQILRRPANPALINSSRWGPAFSLLALAMAVALPYLMPVPSLPEPTGPYQVGTRTFYLVDASRQEIYAGKTGEPRRLMLQVWYPANPAPGSRPAAWMPHAEIIAPAIAKYLGLPAFSLDHLVLARTHAFTEAPLDSSAAPYPLLIYVHGWNGFRAVATHQMEELASHGYVVAALDHTYGSIVTVLPDGQVAYNNPNALIENGSELQLQQSARRLVEQWVDDIDFALAQLAEMNGGEKAAGLAGAIDLERIGIFGHSIGGGATIQFCSQDSRCKAGLTQDAWMAPVSAAAMERGVSQPFLFLFSEAWLSPHNNAGLFEQFYAHAFRSDGVLTILGTSHYDFTDLPGMSPIASWIHLKGPLNGKRVMRIIDDYDLAFFNLHLKDQPTDLFIQPATAYPEVRYDQIPSGQ